MNDADYEATKARIMAVLESWSRELGLGWWRVDAEWVRDPGPSEGSSHVAAECAAAWKYMEATITFYVQTFADMDDNRLEYCVVHELMHALVNEMRWVKAPEPGSPMDTDSMDHEERVTTTLAKAFRWVRDAAAEGKLPSPSLAASEAETAEAEKVLAEYCATRYRAPLESEPQ